MDLNGLGIVAGVILGEVRMDKRQTKNNYRLANNGLRTAGL